MERDFVRGRQCRTGSDQVLEVIEVLKVLRVQGTSGAITLEERPADDAVSGFLTLTSGRLSNHNHPPRDEPTAIDAANDSRPRGRHVVVTRSFARSGSTA